MAAFNEAWTLLKELSPSAQIMQDNAREALENRGSGYSQPNSIYQQMPFHRFSGHNGLYRPVQSARMQNAMRYGDGKPVNVIRPPEKRDMPVAGETNDGTGIDSHLLQQERYPQDRTGIYPQYY